MVSRPGFIRIFETATQKILIIPNYQLDHEKVLPPKRVYPQTSLPQDEGAPPRRGCFPQTRSPQTRVPSPHEGASPRRSAFPGRGCFRQTSFPRDEGPSPDEGASARRVSSQTSVLHPEGTSLRRGCLPQRKVF